MDTAKRILACDIDGTLLNNGDPTPGIKGLQKVLDSRQDVHVVYATGRTFASTMKLVEMGVLPEPDAVAPQIGTELWLPPWDAPRQDYFDYLSEGWDEPRVREVTARFDRVTPQGEEAQTPFKASYFLGEDDLEVLAELRQALLEEGLKPKILYSKGKFLDLLPPRAGKRGVLRYLVKLWGKDLEILAAGDSGNDLDMLSDPRFFGVIVGNSDDDQLEDLNGDHRVYRAALPHASGVLEGMAAHGFWST